jgi:hypothetical protein
MTGERTRKPNGRSSIFLAADGRWHGFVTMVSSRMARLIGAM